MKPDYFLLSESFAVAYNARTEPAKKKPLITRILSWIPFTPQSRTDLKERQAREELYRANVLENIATFADRADPKIKTAIERCDARLAHLSVREDRCTEYELGLVGISAMLAYLGMPVLIQYLLGFNPGTTGSFMAWAICIICEALATFILMAPVILAIDLLAGLIIPQTVAIATSLGIAICYGIGIYQFLVVQLHESSAWTPFLITGAMAGGLICVAIILFVGIPIALCEDMLKYRKRRRYTLELAMRNLVDLLSRLDVCTNWNWLNLEEKQEKIKILEELAILFSDHWPRALNACDENTQHWLECRGIEIGKFFRALKRWVSLPKADTHVCLQKCVADCLVVTASGAWDELHRISQEVNRQMPMEDKREHITKGRRAVRIATAAAIALMPAILVTIAQRIGILQISSEFRGYVALGAIVWAVIALTVALDPLLLPRIFSVVKDVTSTIKDARSGSKE